MKRMLAVSPATVAAAKPTQASVIHFRVDRRVTPSMSRSGGAAGTWSACFSTVAIVSILSLPKPRRAPQHCGTRRVPLLPLPAGEGWGEGVPKRAPATVSLQRPPRRVPHAKVRIVLRDLLDQRKA